MSSLPWPACVKKFQSTLPVGGATRRSCHKGCIKAISIHAPRGGSDFSLIRFSSACWISIHAPRGGSDLGDVFLLGHQIQFQSTLPVGGATNSNRPVSIFRQHFNPRSPWGERLCAVIALFFQPLISIHAPRGGSDWACLLTRPSAGYFNPRSPWGERLQLFLHISGSYHHFNPRSPWGERPVAPESAARNTMPFQSTLPVGGATRQGHVHRGAPADFNPRSPWGERRASPPVPPGANYFNPRSPWGERPRPPGRIRVRCQFQSTLPVGGATGSRAHGRRSSVDFNPRSPWGERRG